MNALAMYYDPKVWYKNDLIFNFMNFNEKFINGKSGKIKRVNLQNDLYLGTQKP